MPDPGSDTSLASPAHPDRAAAFMLRLSESLATAPLSVQDRLAAIADAVVPAIADWCVIDIMAGPDAPRLVLVRHADPAVSATVHALRQDYSPNPLAPFGVADVLWDNCPRCYGPIDAARLTDLAVDAHHARALTDLDLRSCVSVPLPGGDRPFGVMTWATTAPMGSLDDERLALAHAAANVAAAALDQARRHESHCLENERRELEVSRLQRLQGVSVALAAAMTVDAISAEIRHTILLGLKAQVAGIALADAEGSLRLVDRDGWQLGDPDDPRALSLDRDTPLGDAFATGEAVYVEGGPQLRMAYPKALPAFAASRVEAVVAVPLQGQHERLGVIAFGFAYPRRFGDADRQFITAVAAQCALALDRARLYAEKQRQVREREFLLTTLTHDLKNPLTIIQMHAYMMRQGGEGERLRAAPIQQASDRMLHLVENLNDLALLGTLSELAEMQPFSPDAMAQAARADAESLLQAKRVNLRTALAADLPMPVGDVGRLQRALSNVLQYSARRAPVGGELRLSLSVQPAGMVWIDVQDDGPAVGPEDEARIFDAYSEAATGGSYTIGLGMAVARLILEAHGGSLTIVPSAGSWVRLALPVASPQSP